MLFPQCALAVAMIVMMSSVSSVYESAFTPEAHHIANVPLAGQHPNWCGPDALAAVLQFHGDTITAQAIAEAIYLPHYHGSLNLDLLVYARQRGFTVRAENGTPEALTAALRQDHPVICMVRKHGVLESSNHYVIVRGYDRSAGIWFVDSGAGKEERIEKRAFLKQWEGCERWMLVVEGKADEQHATAQ